MDEAILDWQELPDDQVEAHFNPRMAVPDAASRLQAWADRSARLGRQLKGRFDVRYGDGPKMTFDACPGRDPDAATVVFIHGGYWRNLDKKTHLFVVEGLLRGGLNVVNLNYDLCPDVTLTELNIEIAAGLRHVARSGLELGLGHGGLFVMGHSAGAHAAAMVATDPELASLIEGIIPVSGIYDTRAVTRTTINQDVRMTEPEAAALNVLATMPQPAMRILCSVGGDEPPAWIGQTVAYHRLGQRHAAQCRVDVIEGANHFTVLEAVCDPDHPSGKKLLAFVRGR